MRLLRCSFVLACALCASVFAQQPDTTKPAETAKPREKKTKPESSQPAPEPKTIEPAAPAPESKPDAGKESAADKEEHFDMTEVPPVVTHHQMTVDGKTLRYTATAGRLPIKRGDGKIEAEMFFVAYTLDGQEANQRPVTFCFNGGPGSASVWLHMGSVGPKQVVLQPNGFMPAAPYRITDNPNTLLDKSDLVFVDAIATGFSRAANAELQKKFLGVKGDIEAFGEFIRLYITRYDRWPSPLFILGESYGTTRAAGIAELSGRSRHFIQRHHAAFDRHGFRHTGMVEGQRSSLYFARALIHHDCRLSQAAGARSHAGSREDPRGSGALGFD